MLNNISLKFTEIPDPVVVPTQGITVFVGPNNAGKSMLLREIEAAISTNGTIETKLLSDFDLIWPSQSQFDEDLLKLARKAPIGASTDLAFVGRFTPAGRFEQGALDRRSLLDVITNRKDKHWLASQFYQFLQIRLDGKTRFDLTNDQPTGDLIAAPHNILVHIFQDEMLRKQLSDIIFDAFGFYFVIDPLKGGQLRIRLPMTEPTHDEQSLGPAAREYHKAATYIKDASDGVQAFVGILAAVLSGDYRAILIDEPEAFLHPPLARKLGHELASIMSERNGCLLASTHSAAFLIGCLQASPNVRVVRLEYSNNKSKGQIVDPVALTKFFKAPLVRSANVISALFHDGLVATESDNDRAFYGEVYYRLAEVHGGYPSLLFVNAQNKQTIRDIIGPLRRFGVPAAAVVDIDILKDGGATWTGWLEAAQVPESLRKGFGQMRGDLYHAFEKAQINMKVDGGINALGSDDRDAANELFDNLARYGVFVTRMGELENWLLGLGVPGKKTDWTMAMLDRMGADPSDSAYVRPIVGDVWDFMRGIVSWIRDPARKGTN